MGILCGLSVISQKRCENNQPTKLRLRFSFFVQGNTVKTVVELPRSLRPKSFSVQ